MTSTRFKTCEACGKEFPRWNPKKRYCDATCRKRAARQRSGGLKAAKKVLHALHDLDCVLEDDKACTQDAFDMLAQLETELQRIKDSFPTDKLA